MVLRFPFIAQLAHVFPSSTVKSFGMTTPRFILTSTRGGVNLVAEAGTQWAVTRQGETAGFAGNPGGRTAQRVGARPPSVSTWFTSGGERSPQPPRHGGVTARGCKRAAPSIAPGKKTAGTRPADSAREPR